MTDIMAISDDNRIRALVNVITDYQWRMRGLEYDLKRKDERADHYENRIGELVLENTEKNNRIAKLESELYSLRSKLSGVAEVVAADEVNVIHEGGDDDE